MESLHLVLLRCHFLPRGLRLAAILPIGGVKLSLIRLHSAINTLIHFIANPPRTPVYDSIDRLPGCYCTVCMLLCVVQG